jgi:transcriptional regulator with XRE-family HTH domain
MSTTSTPERKIHQGHNIKRFRAWAGIKQQALAIDLGDDWNQKKVSRLEEKEEVDADLLEKISKILNVPMETLETYEPENGVVNIQNNYEGSNPGVTNVSSSQTNCTFNPLDEVKKLNDANVALYERLLAAEKEKNEFLQQMLDKKK